MPRKGIALLQALVMVAMAHLSSHWSRSSRHYLAIALLTPVVSLLWAYWTTLGESADRWAHDPQYSHGYLVPIFAVALLWIRRNEFRLDQMAPTWWGLPILVGSILLRLTGTYFHFIWLDAISLLPCMVGLCLLVAGWQALRWAWPAILFLAFMIPLPYRLGIALADPLRHFATLGCTFILQTLGMPAISEGNRVLLNEVDLDIVGACSGLGMLHTFVALSTGLALVLRRPLWEKLVIVASSIPIAMIANISRITATGIVYEIFGRVPADEFCRTLSAHSWHDLAGWLMMPIGLVLLWIVLKIVSNLMVEVATPASVRLRGGLQHS